MPILPFAVVKELLVFDGIHKHTVRGLTQNVECVVLIIDVDDLKFFWLSHCSPVDNLPKDTTLDEHIAGNCIIVLADEVGEVFGAVFCHHSEPALDGIQIEGIAFVIILEVFKDEITVFDDWGKVELADFSPEVLVLEPFQIANIEAFRITLCCDLRPLACHVPVERDRDQIENALHGNFLCYGDEGSHLSIHTIFVLLFGCASM